MPCHGHHIPPPQPWHPRARHHLSLLLPALTPSRCPRAEHTQTTGHLPRGDHGSISARLGPGTATDLRLLCPLSPPRPGRTPVRCRWGRRVLAAAPGSLLGVQTAQLEAPTPLSPSGPAAFGGTVTGAKSRIPRDGRGDAARSEHPAERGGAEWNQKVEKLRGAAPEPRRSEAIAPSPGWDGSPGAAEPQRPPHGRQPAPVPQDTSLGPSRQAQGTPRLGPQPPETGTPDPSVPHPLEKPRISIFPESPNFSTLGRLCIPGAYRQNPRVSRTRTGRLSSSKMLGSPEPPGAPAATAPDGPGIPQPPLHPSPVVPIPPGPRRGSPGS